MTTNRSQGHGEPKFGKTVLEDLRRDDLKRTVRRDFEDLKEFYLNEERRKRLADMGLLKRWFYMTGWLLQSLFFKLTPVRRILLLIGSALILIPRFSEANGEHIHLTIFGGLVLLFVLMLELKDKLLAKDELEVGRSVQYALMPKRSPVVPGWSVWLFTRPANEVGGDLVDFQQINERRYGAALGDVAGKGLGAALLMAKLQATLRALAPDFDSLAKLGAKMNAIFCRDSLPNSFASLIYLEFGSDSGVVRFLNAGHIPPVVVQGPAIAETPKGETALGILPDATYSEQSIELHKGDILLAYSDGLTEARNEQGNFFGEQRVLRLLPELGKLTARELGERLLQEIDHFVGEARASDDLSLVILKRVD